MIGTFVGDAKKPFEAEFSKQLKNIPEAEKLLESLVSASYTVSNIEVKP